MAGQQARILQDYQNLVLVASQALGSGSKGKKEKGDRPVQTAEEAQAAFKSVFG